MADASSKGPPSPVSETGDDSAESAVVGAKGPREHARKPIELQVEYKRLNAFFADYTKNISKGGTFIKTDKLLDVGTEFIFTLHVPGLEQPLSITGQVQWVRSQQDIDANPSTDANAPGMGIRFVYASEAERATVERRIEKIMIDSLGHRLYSRLMEYSQSNVADDKADPTGESDSSSRPNREQ